MTDHGKLIGQLKDLADYHEPNDIAAAAIIRQAVAALSKQPDEAAVDLLRRMWDAWGARDGDDVFTEHGGEIKALFAALQADTPDKEMGDG